MRKRKWGLAAAAAALAVAIGAGVVMAQSEDDGTGIAFLDRVAEKLGVDRATLDTAIQDARSDEIDEALADGRLTKEQADRLKERLDDLPADAPFIAPAFGHRFPGGELFGLGDGFGFAFKFGAGGHGVGFDNEAMAEFLGIDQGTLADELRADGATLASVAQAHGKGRDELIAFIVGDLPSRLDERVATGDLTQERAQEILAEANQHIGEMVDQEFGERPFASGRKGEFGLGVPFGLPGPGFVPQDIAEFLGIDEDQLFEELRADGATLATVADAHGKSRDDLKVFLAGAVREKLDTMVADGMLERARADEILANFNERLDAMIDGQFRGVGGRFRGGPPTPFEREMFEFGDEMFGEQMEIQPGDGAQESELIPASRS